MNRRGARIRTPDWEPNSDRWMVSYADFLTLLLAVFVVMYAAGELSDVPDEGAPPARPASPVPSRADVPRPAFEWALFGPTGGLIGLPVTPRVPARGTDGRVEFSDASLVDRSEWSGRPATETPPTQIPELQVGKPAHDNPDDEPRLEDGIIQEHETRPSSATQPVTPLTDESAMPTVLQLLRDAIEASMPGLLDSGQFRLRESKRGVEIEIRDNLLFELGQAKLEGGAIEVLQSISRLLMPLENEIRVEGYTDDLPISTVEFPSNWELSAARAASVVHLFARSGIEPGRMAAVGYGEHRPVAPNTTLGGRQRNRRVSILVVTDERELPWDI